MGRALNNEKNNSQRSTCPWPEKIVIPGSIALSPPSLSHSLFFKYLFTYFWLLSGLPCCARLLIAVACLGQSTGSKVQTSVVVVPGLRCSVAYGILVPGPCPLHCKADFLTAGLPEKSLSYSLDGSTTLRLALPGAPGEGLRAAGTTLYHTLSGHTPPQSHTILTTCRPQDHKAVISRENLQSALKSVP